MIGPSARGAMRVNSRRGGSKKIGIAIAAAAVVAGVLYLLYAAAFAMPGARHRGPLPPPSAEEEALAGRLREHVEHLASVIGPRDRPGPTREAAAYLEAQLAGLGYTVRSRPFEAYGHAHRNLEVELPGEGPIVLMGAHYDSVRHSPGANDNASGCAALLEVARRLAGRGGERTLRLVWFAAEEPPFFDTEAMGSRAYARESAAAGEAFEAVFALDSLAYYSDAPSSQRYPPVLGLFFPERGDFLAFVSNFASRRLLKRSIAAFRSAVALPTEGVAAPASLPGVGWSDHASFWHHGYPGVLITDTALYRDPAYHHAEDTPERLDYLRLARVTRGLVRLLEETAGLG